MARELERPGGRVPEKLGYAFWHRSPVVGWALAGRIVVGARHYLLYLEQKQVLVINDLL